MCRPTKASRKSENVSITDKLFGMVWPMPVWAALIPTYCYLNRGFTQWFSWVSVLYMLTQSEFLVKFQALLGTSVCLGWYVSLAYEYVQHGRFLDVLFKNMPETMTAQMINASTGELNYESMTSLWTMLLAIVIDFCFHPFQTYCFWRRHDGKLAGLLSWNVIISSYLFSRLWSVIHTYYNFGTPLPFYVGHDVYTVDSLDSWYPAYIAEAVVYLSVVVWKILLEGFEEKKLSKDNTQKPELIHSDSIESDCSQ